MTYEFLLLTIFGLATYSFFLSRKKAIALNVMDPLVVHSQPHYHGLYSAMLTITPAIILLFILFQMFIFTTELSIILVLIKMVLLFLHLKIQVEPIRTFSFLMMTVLLTPIQLLNLQEFLVLKLISKEMLEKMIILELSMINILTKTLNL